MILSVALLSQASIVVGCMLTGVYGFNAGLNIGSNIVFNIGFNIGFQYWVEYCGGVLYWSWGFYLVARWSL